MFLVLFITLELLDACYDYKTQTFFYHMKIVSTFESPTATVQQYFNENWHVRFLCDIEILVGAFEIFRSTELTFLNSSNHELSW